MRHFEYFPKIEYGDNLAVNITVRAKIRNAILQKTALYYKYKISEGDRPDILAKKYYGNYLYTWVIFYANDMFHPVLDWPMESSDFTNYLKSKYGGIDTIQNIKLKPHHYEFTDPSTKRTYIIDEETHQQYSSEYPDFLRAVSFYDYEVEQNEKKRNIVVLDKQYLYQITNELELLFK